MFSNYFSCRDIDDISTIQKKTFSMSKSISLQKHASPFANMLTHIKSLNLQHITAQNTLFEFLPLSYFLQA